MGDNAARRPAPADSSDGPLRPGSDFEGYRIHRLLGQGTMGAVYLASNARRRLVAIKALALAQQFDRDDLPAARERFATEARSAARLKHPCIARVYTSGQARGIDYLVMQALPGCSLDRYAQPARLLPEPLALHVAASVGEGLAHAHAHGVLHRDVKPANVMLEAASRRVKILDFGLSRLTDNARTRTGLVLGTPAFMAPELLAGSAAHPGSDLYALGVLLFQLLTARLPYEGDSMGALLRAIASGPPQALATLRPDLPAGLGALVARLLDKSPLTRPADGTALAAELREHIARWSSAALHR